MAQANVYGLLLVQSDLEATLGQINYTLGYPINTGVSQFNWNPNAPQVATTLPFNNAGRPTDCTASLWDTCTGAYAPTAYALGANGLETGTDEVAAPLFVKAAGATAVSMTVVARFSPYGSLPFGWYASTAPTTLNPVGTMDYTADAQTNSKARMVFPPTCKGSTMQACPTTEFDATYTFDPAAASFGLYFVEARELRWRVGFGWSREFVAELEHHALGGFFADAGYANELLDFVAANGAEEVGGGDAAEDFDGERGTDAADADQLFEEIFFIRREEAVEREGVFANMSVDAEAGLAADAGEMGKGGNGDGDVVTDAANIEDGLVGRFFDQGSAQQRNHGDGLNI